MPAEKSQDFDAEFKCTQNQTKDISIFNQKLNKSSASICINSSDPTMLAVSIENGFDL